MRSASALLYLIFQRSNIPSLLFFEFNTQSSLRIMKTFLMCGIISMLYGACGAYRHTTSHTSGQATLSRGDRPQRSRRTPSSLVVHPNAFGRRIRIRAFLLRPTPGPLVTFLMLRYNGIQSNQFHLQLEESGQHAHSGPANQRPICGQHEQRLRLYMPHNAHASV